MKRMLPALRRLDRNLLIILALSLFAWAPLLTPAYFFQAHDAPHSIFYLVEFDQTLRDGYLWPRWAPDFAFGYGYPLFNIYAPLAIYAAEILHLLGLGFEAAVKVVYALATMGAGLTMYLFVHHLPAPGEGQVFGRKAGLLAAVVYMYVPFHLVEIFVRSAYSEFVALALLPLVLYAFTQLVSAPSLRRLALAGLVYGVLALTHHTSFFTFTPFLVVYILYLLAGIWQDKGIGHALRTALFTVGGGVLGLALSAIYLLPMLAELRYVKIEQWTAYNYDYGQHFVYFSQLLSPDWGYGYSGPGLNDGMSFQLGAVTLVLVIFGGWLALTRRHARSGSPGSHGPHPGIDLFFLASTAVIVWLMSPAAQFAWRALPIASLVQFPWRLLGLAALTMSVVAGSLLAGGGGESGNQGIRNQGIRESGNQESGIRGSGDQGIRDQGVGGSEIRDSGNQEFRNSGKTTDSLSPDSPSPDSLSPDPPIPDSPTPDSLLLLLIIILGSFAYTLPQYTPVEAWRTQPEAVVRWDRFSPAERVGMVIYTDEQPTTGPMEAQYLAGEPLQVATILSGTGTVQTQRHAGASDQVLVNANGPVTVQFYTYDFPGWQAMIDGQPTAHRHEPPYGLITLDVPAGQHTVSIRMGSTPPRTAGSVISLIAAIAIGVGLFGERIWRRVLPLL
jgi:hypothetical protein